MSELSQPDRTEVASSDASAAGTAVAASSGALVRTGQPYHLLARNSAHRWWRPLAALVVFVVLAVLALLVGSAVLSGMGMFPLGTMFARLELFLSRPEALDGSTEDPMWLLFLGFAGLALLIPAVLLTARWIQKRPFGSVSGVTGGLRWSWFGRCLPIAVAVLGAAFLTQVAWQSLTGETGEPGAFPGWGVYLRVLLLAVLIVPLQSAAEEYVFRGLLLQTLTAWFRTPWVAMVVTSVLFLLGHGYTDPLVWCELMLMAMVGCWLTVRTGGLEATIAMHVVNNGLSLVLSGLSGIPDLEQAGDFTLSEVVPFMVAMPVYGWWVDRNATRQQVSTVIGGRARIAPWSLRPRDDLSVRASG